MGTLARTEIRLSATLPLDSSHRLSRLRTTRRLPCCEPYLAKGVQPPRAFVMGQHRDFRRKLFDKMLLLSPVAHSNCHTPTAASSACTRWCRQAMLLRSLKQSAKASLACRTS